MRATTEELPEIDRLRVEEALTSRLHAAGLAESWSVHVRLLGVADAYAAPKEPPAPSPGATLVPVQLHGRYALLGPFGPPRPDPGRPCFHCVATRWQTLRPAVERDALERGPAAPLHAAAPNPYLTPFALDMLAHLATSALTTRHREPPVPRTGTVYRLALDTLGVERARLLADPACPWCGAEQAAPPAALASGPVPLRPGLVPRPGSSRLLSPAEAVPEWAADALANPVCGALGTGVRPDREAANTAPATGRFAVRGAPSPSDVHWSGHADTYRDSTALALCEGLERLAGLRDGDVHIRAARSRLRHPSVNPRECGLPHAAFFEGAPSHFVPYDEELVLPWVWGWSLRDERPVLVPEQLVHYRLAGPGPFFAVQSSSGCAGGSCVEEAVLHGLLEVVERDAFLVAWLGRARLPQIAVESCRSPSLRSLAERIRRGGYRLRLFDNRIDLPVPVVTAVATREDGGPGALCLSSAAAFDPERAAESAVREVASSLSGFAERTVQDLERLRAMARDFDLVRELGDHAALYGLPEMTRHAAFLLGDEDRARPPAETLSDDERGAGPARDDRGEGVPPAGDLSAAVRHCRDLLAARGFDTVVVDQTGPEQRAVGASVVRVLVPGLLPIDFGAGHRAPGMARARTALRSAGLRADDLTAAELNPAPHPFM
ncbi:TOMM precursor leader peptide-binding protein [Streptomyces sp. NBC_01795]|uniref:TOMM precursor leader peptide-binding protein n=1 Tax=Streptomyces sp. NBC_01795 TaxID=2975943 RepID=UPI002DD84A01|nr:TOMM precursor leader peptide-binding protein [Streptomyces sp. NBC_01795]WSA96124.1 TOMM precursor leader peptide-binding protein [Streptomyces sp. NBC_01795]